MKPYGFFPDAQAEFDAALASSRKPGEFQRVVQEAINDIDTGLMTHAAVRKTPCRRCVLKKRIPYSIIYIETDAEIRIVAFAHHKRRPGYWKKRLP
ncbi:MAG: hypothetical protein U0792_11545 [Gemmataceae bacterium]